MCPSLVMIPNFFKTQCMMHGISFLSIRRGYLYKFLGYISVKHSFVTASLFLSRAYKIDIDGSESRLWEKKFFLKPLTVIASKTVVNTRISESFVIKTNGYLEIWDYIVEADNRVDKIINLFTKGTLPLLVSLGIWNGLKEKHLRVQDIAEDRKIIII